MSRYTTNFKTLIDGGFVSRSDIEDIFKSYNLSDFLTPDEIEVINNRGTWTPDKLAEKIVDHYYLREIGFETYAMFRHYAKIEMKEIMESKLPLIYSSAIKYDPLVNVDYTEELNRNISGTDNAFGSGKSLVVDNDTPQTNINREDLYNGTYASNVSASDNSTSSTNNTDSTETYTKHIKGNSGVTASAQAMVKQYRDNIRAIDYEIINELNDLFIGLF